jgi:hypothetical protein
MPVRASCLAERYFLAGALLTKCPRSVQAQNLVYDFVMRNSFTIKIAPGRAATCNLMIRSHIIGSIRGEKMQLPVRPTDWNATLLSFLHPLANGAQESPHIVCFGIFVLPGS